MYPYVCTQGQTVNSLAGQSTGRVTELNCVAGPGGVFVYMYICDTGDLEASDAGCPTGVGAKQVIQLYMAKQEGESASIG